MYTVNGDDKDDNADDDDDSNSNNNNNIIILIIMSPCIASTINLRFLSFSDNLLKGCGKCKPVLMSRKSKFCPES
jgi:hypothetical protein